MEIRPFKDLKVTTMTLIAPFEGEVHMEPVFCLLPITPMVLPPTKRSIKKIRIPHCSTPGAILSLRYAGYTRGIFRSASRTHFRNSITMDISTCEKNVSLKLSKRKIQMCGPTSVQMGLEAIQYLFSHLNTIQEELTYFSRNPEKLERTLTWLKEHTRGDPCIRETRTAFPTEKVILLIRKKGDDHSIRIPKEFPPEIDPKIASFFLRPCGEFVYHSELCREFDRMAQVSWVIDRPLKVVKICKAMVNYNYNLGFPIYRQVLAQAFESLEGWYANYDPLIHHTVTIQVPYEVPEDSKFMRKENKVPCHTFMIYRSGVITQSGPDETMMEEIYIRFMDILQSIQDQIRCEE